MHLQLITPEKILFEGDAEQVIAPGTEGEFGVLPGHAPFISTLKPGVITVDLADKEQRKVAVLSGIAEVTPEKCVILADVAVDCTDVTPAAAATKLQEAKAAAANAVTEAEQKSAARNLAIAQAIAQAA